MKLFKTCIVFVILFCSSISFFGCTTDENQQSPSVNKDNMISAKHYTQPALVTGDNWTYRNIGEGLNKIWEYQITGTATIDDNEVYVMQVTITDIDTQTPFVPGGGLVTEWIDKQTLQVVKDKQGENGELLRELSYNCGKIPYFPIIEGNMYQCTVTNENNWSGDTTKNRYNQSIEVECLELITVPAGTFECFKMNVFRDETFQYSYWYSEEVKSFVKKTFRDQQMILESFTVTH